MAPGAPIKQGNAAGSISQWLVPRGTITTFDGQHKQGIVWEEVFIVNVFVQVGKGHVCLLLCTQWHSETARCCDILRNSYFTKRFIAALNILGVSVFDKGMAMDFPSRYQM
jgi:hypothetical protein